MDSQPTITVQPTQPVKENEFVTIHCESNGGNPPPKFSWIFNNNSVVPDSWYQDKSKLAPRETSVSVLQWRVNAQDNGAYLTCQIWNEAMQKDEYRTVETNRLNVLFAPRVTVGPVADYNVEEGEPVELTCNAEGNPLPTQFEWLHVSTGERVIGKQWKFIADKRMRGDFRCTAVNSIDMGAGKLNMNVFYTPVIKVPKVSNPAEGEQLILECDIDANPNAEQIMWTGPNGFSQIGSRLMIDTIQRENTGNYTCQAENSFALFSTGDTIVRRMGKNSTFIDVKRRPGKAMITASHSSVNVGETITLSCIAEDLGSPEAKFRWAVPASHGMYSQEPEYNRHSITINKAALSDNGIYRCVAFNNIGQGDEATIKITVVEAARISRPLTPNRVLTSGDIDAAIDCEAIGFPQPQIKWLKNGQSINEAINSHWVIQSHPSQTSCNNGEFCPWTVTSSLRFFKTVEWSDKGNYTCIAENGAIGPLAQASTILNVIHDPVILNEKYPTEALSAADIGAHARITCRVSARPEPKFTWIRDGIEITDTDERLMVHASKIYHEIDEYESVLEINDVEESDMTQYVCKAVNGQSSVKTAEIVIKLQPKSKPQIPRSVQLYEATPTSLTVSWRPGFNGGDHQYFELEYRIGSSRPGSEEKSNPTIFVLDDHNATAIAIFETDQTAPPIRHRRSSSAQIVNFLVHNLTMLNPMTVYWYRIRSRNAYGYSEWNPIASAMTLDVSESVDIQPPTSLVYYEEEKKLTFEPLKSSNGSCLLLYISGSDNNGGSANNAAPTIWRTLGCFPGDHPIENIEPSEHFKARFCHHSDLSVCSSSVEILVTTSTMPAVWMHRIIFPLIIVITIIALIVFLFFICLKTRLFSKRKDKAKKKFAAVIGDAERAEVSAPMPQIEAKNTPVHGSQTDSGVFTLGSNPATQPANQASSLENGYNNESEGCGDSWQNTSDEHFNYNNDPYMAEYNNQFPHEMEYQVATSQSQPAAVAYQPYFDGYKQEAAIHIMPSSDEQTDGSSETSSCPNGSRRVMREIIV
uniref:Uncharacterized protein n=1 Tax=Panagrolaimus sp. PS1159 TaxID=55785 RepID=A0AC35F2G5_9BILA